MSQSARFESNTAFINYPKQAVFGRTLPKNKIYEHSGANTRLKDLFVEQVEQIVWQYKLAPETINLPAAGSTRASDFLNSAQDIGAEYGRFTLHRWCGAVSHHLRAEL